MADLPPLASAHLGIRSLSSSALFSVTIPRGEPLAQIRSKPFATHRRSADRLLTDPFGALSEQIGLSLLARIKDIKTLQKFAAAQASIHDHFNQERHLNRRDIFRKNRSAALAEWRQLAA